MRAPWRPQDMADTILGRPSRVAPHAEMLAAYGEVEMEVDADEVFIITLEGAGGREQPVLWPMLLHRHGQDCGRG